MYKKVGGMTNRRNYYKSDNGRRTTYSACMISWVNNG